MENDAASYTWSDTMKSCEQYREYILDHLYGLLEPPESADLASHLEACEACRTELARAEKQKKLLGVAARTQLAGFEFTRPVESQSPSRLRSYSPAPGMRWAMAAAVFLAVAGIGLPGGYYWHQQDRVAHLESRLQGISQAADRTQEEYHDRVAGADAEVQTLQKQLADTAENRQKKFNQIQNDINTHRLNVTVTGPQTLVAGAPNRFRVVTTDLNRQPAPTNLSVKVVNSTQATIYQKENVRSNGNQEIPLPADLPVTPSSDLTLVVSARGPQSGGELTEKISLAAPVYIAHLAPDKPMYQPGETVHFRSLTLDRFSLKPAA